MQPCLETKDPKHHQFSQQSGSLMCAPHHTSGHTPHTHVHNGLKQASLWTIPLAQLGPECKDLQPASTLEGGEFGFPLKVLYAPKLQPGLQTACNPASTCYVSWHAIAHAVNNATTVARLQNRCCNENTDTSQWVFNENLVCCKGLASHPKLQPGCAHSTDAAISMQTKLHNESAFNGSDLMGRHEASVLHTAAVGQNGLA